MPRALRKNQAQAHLTVMQNKTVESLISSIRRVEAMFEEKDYERASMLIGEIEARAAQAGISSPFLYWLRAIVDDYRGQHAEAFRAVEAAIVGDPLSPALHHSRQIILGHLKTALASDSSADDAPRIWTLLTEEGEADDGTHLALARHLLKVGEPEEALEILNAVTTLSPANADAWGLRIAAASALGRTDALEVVRAEAAAAGLRPIAFVTPAVGKV